MSLSPEAVANHFLHLAKGEGRSLTNMALQKLVYIANGFSLALNDEPLIRTDPQAWDYGPVFPSLYSALRKYGAGVVTEELPAPDAVCNRMDASIIENVWRAYGDRDGVELSLLTHREGSPWSKVYVPQQRNTPIPSRTIRSHYLDLVDGEGNGAL